MQASPVEDARSTLRLVAINIYGIRMEGESL